MGFENILTSFFTQQAKIFPRKLAKVANNFVRLKVPTA
jgi:hypothetical protein